jgi:hypothetical protein
LRSTPVRVSMSATMLAWREPANLIQFMGRGPRASNQRLGRFL